MGAPILCAFGVEVTRTFETAGEVYTAEIIGNAIKYSPAGSRIEIPGSQAGAMVTDSVRDEGPRITEGEVNAIFERYYRGSRTQENVPGTGMGLTIARVSSPLSAGGSERRTGRPQARTSRLCCQSRGRQSSRHS